MAMEAAITLHKRGHKVTLFSPEHACVIPYESKDEPQRDRELLKFLKAETGRKVRVVASDVTLRNLPGKFEAVVMATEDEYEFLARAFSAEMESRDILLSRLTHSLHKALIAGYEAALKI
jgi:hypothetical protein